MYYKIKNGEYFLIKGHGGLIIKMQEWKWKELEENYFELRSSIISEKREKWKIRVMERSRARKEDTKTADEEVRLIIKKKIGSLYELKKWLKMSRFGQVRVSYGFGRGLVRVRYGSGMGLARVWYGLVRVRSSFEKFLIKIKIFI